MSGQMHKGTQGYTLRTNSVIRRALGYLESIADGIQSVR
jgi:hypothetical protein